MGNPYWAPAIVERQLYGQSPEAGEIIGHQYKAWRVVAIRNEAGVEIEGRVKLAEPYEVVVTPAFEDDGKHYGMAVKGYQSWSVLPEHYAVCGKCGDLSPCRESEEAKEAEREIKRSIKAMKLPDGFCPACEEPITRRQKSHRFPGPNLLNPFAKEGVTYHTRRKCAGRAAAYEESWIAADPSRKRSLLTLRCEGRLTVHADGTGECHGRNSGGECPHIYARHQGASACFLLTHGCPRGCERSGHPGTRLASGLASDGTSLGLLSHAEGE